MAQAAKNLPTMQETQAQFLGREDPRKKGMANNFNILAWIILWTEESSSLYSPWGCKDLDVTEWRLEHFCYVFFGECLFRSSAHFLIEFFVCFSGIELHELLVYFGDQLFSVVSIDRKLTFAKTVKNSPVMQETWVQSLGRENLLEKEMTTHSNILACRIPWIEEHGGL